MKKFNIFSFVLLFLLMISSVSSTVFYNTTFESPSYSVNNLVGQNDWYGVNTSLLAVISGQYIKCADIHDNNAEDTIAKNITDTGTLVSISFNMSFNTDEVSGSSNLIRISDSSDFNCVTLNTGTSESITVFNGSIYDYAAVSSAAIAKSATWYKYRFDINSTSKTFDVWFNNTKVLTNVLCANSNFNASYKINLSNARQAFGWDKPFYLDDLCISSKYEDCWTTGEVNYTCYQCNGNGGHNTYTNATACDNSSWIANESLLYCAINCSRCSGSGCANESSQFNSSVGLSNASCSSGWETGTPLNCCLNCSQCSGNSCTASVTQFNASQGIINASCSANWENGYSLSCCKNCYNCSCSGGVGNFTQYAAQGIVNITTCSGSFNNTPTGCDALTCYGCNGTGGLSNVSYFGSCCTGYLADYESLICSKTCYASNCDTGCFNQTQYAGIGIINISNCSGGYNNTQSGCQEITCSRCDGIGGVENVTAYERCCNGYTLDYNDLICNAECYFCNCSTGVSNVTVNAELGVYNASCIGYYETIEETEEVCNDTLCYKCSGNNSINATQYGGCCNTWFDEEQNCAYPDTSFGAESILMILLILLFMILLIIGEVFKNFICRVISSLGLFVIGISYINNNVLVWILLLFSVLWFMRAILIYNSSE